MLTTFANSLNGPTAGKIQRPSDGEAPKSVAFVQCAGSRDENYYKHCSGVCCLASLKQARYVRDQYPEAQIFIFYIVHYPGISRRYASRCSYQRSRVERAGWRR